MNQSALASWRRGCSWRSLASFRRAIWVLAWTTCAFAWNVLAYPLQQSHGNAIIVGVVVDENHRPVPRAQVQAFSVKDVRETSGGVQGLIRSKSASTDATGTFRISGLAEGDYLVAAETTPFPNGGQVSARMWAPTFYPSTIDVSEATPVPASEHPSASVTIELVPVTPVRVRGTVTTASGRSPEGFDVALFRRFGGFRGGGTGAVVNAKGMFEIPRVRRGMYELTIEPHGSQPGDDGREFVDQMIEVTDRDLNLVRWVSRIALVPRRYYSIDTVALWPVPPTERSNPWRLAERSGGVCPKPTTRLS